MPPEYLGPRVRMLVAELNDSASRNSSHELTKASNPAVNTPGADKGTTMRLGCLTRNRLSAGRGRP